MGEEKRNRAKEREEIAAEQSEIFYLAAIVRTRNTNGIHKLNAVIKRKKCMVCAGTYLVRAEGGREFFLRYFDTVIRSN